MAVTAPVVVLPESVFDIGDHLEELLKQAKAGDETTGRYRRAFEQGWQIQWKSFARALSPKPNATLDHCSIWTSASWNCLRLPMKQQMSVKSLQNCCRRSTIT